MSLFTLDIFSVMPQMNLSIFLYLYERLIHEIAKYYGAMNNSLECH